MKIPLTFFVVGSLAACASANYVINGSLEINSAGTDVYNMSNATWNGLVANSTAYGPSEELDLQTITGYTPAPCDGLWKASLHTNSAGPNVDGFTLDLSSPLVVGNTYTLSICGAASSAHPIGLLDVGLSTSATSFGTAMISTGLMAIDAWTVYSTTFTATFAATHVSVQSLAFSDGWGHVDDVRLVDAVPEPASLAVLGLGFLAMARRRR